VYALAGERYPLLYPGNRAKQTFIFFLTSPHTHSTIPGAFPLLKDPAAACAQSTQVWCDCVSGLMRMERHTRKASMEQTATV